MSGGREHVKLSKQTHNEGQRATLENRSLSNDSDNTSSRPASSNINSKSNLKFHQSGRLWQLLPIVAKNVILLITSLFFYRFWARTNVRRYIWSTTSFNGETLEYSGRGWEMVVGFLFALIFIISPLGLANIYIQYLSTAFGNVFWLSYIPLYALLQFLIGVGVYRARHYRLSHTLWRSIYFNQTGTATSYGIKHMGFSFLTPLTLGLSLPWQNLVLSRTRINNTWFGDKKVVCKPKFTPLFRAFFSVYLLNAVLIIALMSAIFLLQSDMIDGNIGHSDHKWLSCSACSTATIFLVLLFLVPLVLLLSIFWYMSFEQRYIVSAIKYENLRFQLKISTLGLARLHIGNLVIVTLTLGIGIPFAQIRNFRYYFNRIKIEGQFDPSKIGRSIHRRPRYGEGLADFFNFGSI